MATLYIHVLGENLKNSKNVFCISYILYNLIAGQCTQKYRNSDPIDVQNLLTLFKANLSGRK